MIIETPVKQETLLESLNRQLELKRKVINSHIRDYGKDSYLTKRAENQAGILVSRLKDIESGEVKNSILYFEGVYQVEVVKQKEVTRRTGVNTYSVSFWDHEQFHWQYILKTERNWDLRTTYDKKTFVQWAYSQMEDKGCNMPLLRIFDK